METPVKPAPCNKKSDTHKEPLEFTNGGMTLLKRLINKKILKKMRDKIFTRLTEPGVDTNIRHLAVTLVPINKFNPTTCIVWDLVANFQHQRDCEKKKNTAVYQAQELAKTCVLTGRLAKEVAEDGQRPTSHGNESETPSNESGTLSSLEESGDEIEDAEGIVDDESGIHLNTTKGIMVVGNQALKNFMLI
jgi:hypothetical protein